MLYPTELRAQVDGKLDLPLFYADDPLRFDAAVGGQDCLKA